MINNQNIKLTVTQELILFLHNFTNINKNVVCAIMGLVYKKVQIKAFWGWLRKNNFKNLKLNNLNNQNKYN